MGLIMGFNQIFSPNYEPISPSISKMKQQKFSVVKMLKGPSLLHHYHFLDLLSNCLSLHQCRFPFSHENRGDGTKEKVNRGNKLEQNLPSFLRETEHVFCSRYLFLFPLSCDLLFDSLGGTVRNAIDF